MSAKQSLTIVMALVVSLILTTNPSIAIETMPNEPLITTIHHAPANIHFVIDDSGSMDWEFMTTDANGLYYASGWRYYVFYADSSGGYDNVDNNYSSYHVAPANHWKPRFHGYNRLFYNPQVTYQPWRGKDINGNPYSDIDPTNAPSDPYRPMLYCRNLAIFENASWWVWYDANSDGDKDPNEMYKVVLSGSGSATTVSYYRWDQDPDSYLYVNPSHLHLVSLPPDPVKLTRTPQEELQNFANWYSYYRRREYVAKAAVGKVIDQMNGVKIGISSINNRISFQDNLYVDTSPAGETNRTTLFTKLYSYSSAGYTPLREGLRRIGEYLKGNLAGHPSPIASEEDGGACQRNFTIAMTDGYYNGYFTGVGNVDGGDEGDFGHPGYAGEKPYTDSYYNTLADIAMKYWLEDLVPDLPDDIPELPNDPATWQHMVTYTVAFGVTGTLDPTTDPNTVTWPNPASGDPQKIDDLWHAALNGHGMFLSAQNPQELISSLENIMEDIEKHFGSSASVALNSGKVTDNFRLYQSLYNTDGWWGDVRAYTIDENQQVDQDNPVWQANELLENKDWDSERKIITFNGTSGVPFRWTNLTTSQKNSLNNDSSLLDYLRGDRSKEGTGSTDFRRRIYILGDIVHSSPAFVGIPKYIYEENGYAYFRDYYATRTPVLYVGANDGMLHAFRASDGEELFAYVPNLVYSKLADLADRNYQHQFYVDGTPTVADVYDTTSTAMPAWRKWKTILVCGLKYGGQGYFTLDVTNPPNIGDTESSLTSKVLWEFSDADDADLGYTFSTPIIAPVKGSSYVSNAPLHNARWVVIFGNGYNNSEADGHASTTGHACLYILDAITGTLLKKIDTGVGTVSNPNGLASPAVVDVDGDFLADYVYAGDLQGNLWKFDLTSTSISNWDVAYHNRSGDPVPLFQATDPSGNPQPITVMPEVTLHPEHSGIGYVKDQLGNLTIDFVNTYMVYFGTGRYIYQTDINNKQIQTFYGIWDRGESLGTFNRANNTPLLLEQTYSLDTTSFATPVRIVSNNPISWFITDVNGNPVLHHLGWYIDLTNNGVAEGERVIDDPTVRHGRVIFVTFIPTDNPCAYGGESWLMEVNYQNGGMLNTTVLDLNADNVIDENDRTNNGEVPGGIYLGGGKSSPPVIAEIDNEKEAKFISKTSGETEVVREKGGGSDTGIFYWEEVF